METRESLRWLSIREANEYRMEGRYNADLEGMFQRADVGMMKRRDDTTLVVAPDGRSYWAWCQSDTPVNFGIGARTGEVASFHYADVGPPGAPGEDARWMEEVDGWPAEWTDE